MLLLPVVLFCLSLYVVRIRGPYYLGGNQDPSYFYLFSSLNLSRFTSPDHIEHPGTTVQALGAAVLLGKWAVKGSGPLLESVLRDPEGYLGSINLALNLLIVLAISGVSLRIYQVSKYLSVALAFQLSLLISPIIWQAQLNVSPEALLIVAVLALVFPLIPQLFSSPGPSPTRVLQLSGLTGFLVGFGMATKVTFLPFIALILFFPKIKSKIIFLSAGLAGFILFTLPILKEYPIFFHLLWDAAIHKGYYAQGELGAPGLSALFQSCQALLRAGDIFSINMLSYLVVVPCLTFYLSKTQNGMINRSIKFLWVGGLILFLQLAIVAKHPDIHYMLPAIVLISFLNAVVIFILLKIEARKIVRFCFIIFIITTIIWGIRLNRHIEYWKKCNAELAQLTEVRNGMHNCLVIGYLASSIPEYALSFGNMYRGAAKQPFTGGKYRTEGRYNQQLAELYPHAIFYDIFEKRFYSFKGYLDKNDIVQLLNEKRCILMQGPSFSSLWLYPYYEDKSNYAGDLVLEQITKDSREVLYRVIGFH